MPERSPGPTDPAARMKRVALALLAGAALLYALAVWGGRAHPHAGWGWLAAGAEAAMVGAMADWFAVVALFRHPLGLPIPHTAILPARKARLGRNLADFICDNFLATPQVLAKLRSFDAAGRIAHWLMQSAHAQQLGAQAVALVRLALGALDDARVRDFVARAAGAGLRHIDVAPLAGQLLGALTAQGRHQALLDEVLGQLAELLDDEALQEQLTDAIAREVKALRYVGLDQVAARLATRKIVAAVARTLGETAASPGHPLRLRFDRFMATFIERLQHDPGFIARGERWRDELLAHPALAGYLQGLWGQLRDWLDADLAANEDSAIRQRVSLLAAGLGRRLEADEAMRHWLNEQILGAAPALIERWREDGRRYIEERVAAWDTDALVREVERNIGRDLQFIRINGTLVGGLVGLLIHALTVLGIG
ncbi:DUF445 domain-containing protein [Xenophilus arseniciresistens]|uniref:DUF445 domain-containing protein n=1 Tax=Xenophilus arseniciresistens TaxID=1283306 RepID=A0AAE3NAV7_9BURK|nr:DUF445 domain-containing protein [Xenophilus arseniciresistens]MDA7416922.1 DUF445 domain-containing protein [Xenophilus arseniciresistens]